MVKTCFKDSNGVDFGYKFVEKDNTYREFQKTGPVSAVGGYLWIWGDGGTEPSGRGIGYLPTCALMSPAQTIAGGGNWKTAKITGCTGGVAAVKTDGTLWTWGNGSSGMLGNNTITTVSSPVQTVSATQNWSKVCTAQYSMSAIKTDGTLWTWGGGRCGVLGNNCISGRSSPVQTASGGTNWKSMSMTRDAIAAIKTDGTLWMWGNDNASGRSCPIQVGALQGAIWRDVGTGGGSLHFAAIRDDNSLWTWGLTGLSGNIIDLCCCSSLSFFRATPIETSTGGVDWKTIQEGNNGGASGMFATKKDGTLWAWGGYPEVNLLPSNCNSCYGSVSSATRCGPFKPTLTIPGCVQWKCATTTNHFGVGIKMDGTLWAWGCIDKINPENASFFGPGCNAGKSTCCSIYKSPVQILPGISSWKSVSAGSEKVLAIRES